MPRTHRAVAEIAAEVVARGVPALFVDTCGALDVVRCAARGRPRVAAVVGQIIQACDSGELLLFGPSVLLDEAARNRVEVEADARRRAREIDDAMDSHRRVAGTLGAPYPHTATFTHEDLIVPLVHLHDRLLDVCVHATTDPGLESVA